MKIYSSIEMAVFNISINLLTTDYLKRVFPSLTICVYLLNGSRLWTSEVYHDIVSIVRQGIMRGIFSFGEVLLLLL
jgi:hypothetical protein